MADTSIIYQAQPGSGVIDVWLDYDAQGRGFLAMARNPNSQDNNITIVEIRTAQRGQPFPAAPTWTFTPQHKIDHVKGTHTGATLVIYGDTHLTGGAVGDFIELWKKDDVWAITPEHEAERGGVGGFAPTPDGGGGGGGGEAEVDYARIQGMVDGAKHWVKDQLVYVLEQEVKPQIVAEVAAELSGDPGPIADLLYKRIADGTWEQLSKFGNEVGYKPPKGEAVPSKVKEK